MFDRHRIEDGAFEPAGAFGFQRVNAAKLSLGMNRQTLVDNDRCI